MKSSKFKQFMTVTVNKGVRKYIIDKCIFCRHIVHTQQKGCQKGIRLPEGTKRAPNWLEGAIYLNSPLGHVGSRKKNGVDRWGMILNSLTAERYYTRQLRIRAGHWVGILTKMYVIHMGLLSPMVLTLQTLTN